MAEHGVVRRRLPPDCVASEPSPVRAGASHHGGPHSEGTSNAPGSAGHRPLRDPPRPSLNPYGLFAGVALLGFGRSASVRFGEEHQAVTRPDPAGLDEMLSTWESDAQRMVDVEVCVNSLIRQRDQHIHVPSEGDAEFRIVLSPVLRLVLDLARTPIEYRQLSDKLGSELPAASEAARDRLLGELLRVRLLRSSLRAPATFAFPTDVLPAAVKVQAAGLRTACDLRLDADVRLPQQVLTEAETAATILARLVTHRTGHLPGAGGPRSLPSATARTPRCRWRWPRIPTEVWASRPGSSRRVNRPGRCPGATVCCWSWPAPPQPKAITPFL